MSIKGFSVGGNVERYDYNFLDNLPSEITIDTALSDSSTNPVQNRVVTSAINSANGSISSISREVADLKSALSEYDAEFKRSEWIATKMQTSSSLNVEVYPDRSVQTSGTSMLTLAAVTGFYSYCFIAPKELVVAANADASYYCIGTLQNPIRSSWSTDSHGTMYKMGTSPTRYRASDNNLPTQESPLRIANGTQIVVTVNDSNIPFLDIYSEVFVDFVTEEELEAGLFESKNAFIGCDLLNTISLTVDVKTGRSGSTSSSIGGHPALQLDADARYDSYCFFAPNDMSIVATAENNTYYAITKLTDPNYSDWQTSGSLLWNNGTSVSRVRKSENNLPTTANPMTLQAGTLIAVTVAVGETASILIQNGKTETIKSELLGVASPFIDVEMHNGYFYYYIPTVSGNYLRYKFVHFVDASSNADGWVQRTVDLSPNNKVGSLMQVVCDGEWEMAIKLKDRSDFIGTMNHGSEIATIANLYFDGVKTTVTDGTRLSCKEIRVNQKSTMYDPNDETTVVGYHYRTHFITADGVRIEQRIEWVTDQILDKSYCGMLPAVRGNDAISSVQVTDHAYDGKTYEEYDCATTSLNPYLTSYTDKGNVFYLRGESSGISMSIECDIENRPSSSFTFLSNSAYYNKVYFAYNDSNYQVSRGDVWKWVSIYKIEHAGN